MVQVEEIDSEALKVATSLGASRDEAPDCCAPSADFRCAKSNLFFFRTMLRRRRNKVATNLGASTGTEPGRCAPSAGSRRAQTPRKRSCWRHPRWPPPARWALRCWAACSPGWPRTGAACARRRHITPVRKLMCHSSKERGTRRRLWKQCPRTRQRPPGANAAHGFERNR